MWPERSVMMKCTWMEKCEKKAVMLAHLFVDKTVQDGHQQPLKRASHSFIHEQTPIKTLNTHNTIL